MAAGRALFNSVYAKWIDLPLDKRPKLVVFGESLGSYGGQAAFAGAQDMATRVDGALWSGTPNFTAQWQEITSSRDSGSREAVPVIDDGQSIRFAAYPRISNWMRRERLTRRVLAARQRPNCLVVFRPASEQADWLPSLSAVMSIRE